MRKCFFFLMILFTASTMLHAQGKDEQVSVNHVINDIFDGIATLNIEKIKQNCTSDFMLLENGAVWNTDSISKRLNQLKSISFTRNNHIDFIRTEVNGDAAWVAYNNMADMTVNGEKRMVQWLESAFLVKDGNAWKVKMLHSTLLKPKTD